MSRLEMCPFVCALAVCLCAPMHAATLDAGTQLEIRLKTKVASNGSKAGEAVEATLIQPVVVDGAIVVPAGVAVEGRVKSATAIAKPGDRASLELEFVKLGGAAIDAKVTAVDNARESVDESGEITGILESETLTAHIDRGIASVSKKYSRLGGFLDVVKSAMFQEPDPEIVYDAGVEMTLKLAKAAEWTGGAGAQPAITAISPADELYSMVNSQPWRTTTEGTSTPSDLTNLMFLGSEEQLTAAFEAAGWSSAAQLNAVSKIEVVRAVAESRGYKEAPVSVLMLDERKPDLVFQKQNNTFAKRHHLRIWRRPGSFEGRAIWVCAATHDTGIEFSPEKRTFIHRIDPQIDRERAKVAGDLALTGRVKAMSLVERPEAPQHSQNATGDTLETDGRMAVLVIE
jgi:hypothetical protein